MKNKQILSILSSLLNVEEGESNEKVSLEKSIPPRAPKPEKCFGSEFIGKHVIIRTYSAGVWFGILDQKCGNEIILSNARRMNEWHALKSISLSSVANYGINQSKSSIVTAVPSVWLEAIEILPCSITAERSLREAKDVEAK